MNRILYTLLVAGLLTGCAQTPDIKLGYQLARSDLSLKVVRTVICDEADHPVVVTSVIPTLSHYADPNQQQWLAIGPIAGDFASADVKLERFEDGRIKGVNAVTTGQGEAIIKAIATILPVIPFAGAVPTFPTECAFIKGAGGGKPLTLTFEGPLPLPDTVPGTVWITIPAELGSAFYFQRLSAALGPVCASITGTAAGVVPVEPAVAGPNEVALPLRQPGSVSVRVAGATPGGTCGSARIWDGTFPAGQYGTGYQLPIPKAALFGKQSFAATIAESGALLTIQYGHEAGEAQALNSLATMANALQDTDAEKAAELKSEADLIAQQQRLALCRAKPDECT